MLEGSSLSDVRSGRFENALFLIFWQDGGLQKPSCPLHHTSPAARHGPPRGGEACPQSMVREDARPAGQAVRWMRFSENNISLELYRKLLVLRYHEFESYRSLHHLRIILYLFRQGSHFQSDFVPQILLQVR